MTSFATETDFIGCFLSQTLRSGAAPQGRLSSIKSRFSSWWDHPLTVTQMNPAMGLHEP